MTRIISAAALMAWAFTLDAQINARLDPLADGTTRIEITNDTTRPLIAFGIALKETSGLIDGGILTIYVDSDVDTEAAPVLAGHQRLFETGFCRLPQNGNRACTVFRKPLDMERIF